MSIRTMSTRQLVIWAIAIVAICLGGTAIALAATGGGPEPPQKPLDVAVHDGLAAPQPGGITARIEFKNHLVNSSGIEGDPHRLLLAAHLAHAAHGRALVPRHRNSCAIVERHALWLRDGDARLDQAA